MDSYSDSNSSSSLASNSNIASEVLFRLFITESININYCILIFNSIHNHYSNIDHKFIIYLSGRKNANFCYI